MTLTANLGLPFIEAAQAQKHVTHNEALRILDAATQIAVADSNRAAPPPSPAEGQRHIVDASPTGAWAGKAKAIATWQDGAWAFLAPKNGWCVWSIADGALLVFDGSLWRDTRGLSYDNLVHLGVNTTASSPNLLSVKSNAALIAAILAADGGSGDVRLQISKESAAKTASVFFSDAFSGRAEFGLTGDDDFHLKVSADGATWTEAFRVARGSGRVTFPAQGGPRETLTAARTYYVRSDGSDGNTGLANTGAAAFLTIQKAVDSVCALDLSIFQVTIQIADGTYTTEVALKPYLGALPPILQGNATTPANVLVSTVANAFVNAGAGAWQINSLKIACSAGNGLKAMNGGIIRFQNLDFGTIASYHITAGPGSSVVATGNYTVSGNAQYHVATNGFVSLAGMTLTYVNTPAFSGANIFAGRGGVVDAYAMSFSNAGVVTGQRYAAMHNGVIFTVGGSATYFPGSTAGATSSGGLYV